MCSGCCRRRTSTSAKRIDPIIAHSYLQEYRTLLIVWGLFTEMAPNGNSEELTVVCESNGPTAVVLWMRDGSVQEVLFATRFLAELYLSMVPFVVEPDGGMGWRRLC